MVVGDRVSTVFGVGEILCIHGGMTILVSIPGYRGHRGRGLLRQVHHTANCCWFFLDQIAPWVSFEEIYEQEVIKNALQSV